MNRHRSRVLIVPALAFLLVLPVFAAPAAASDWIFGAAFRVGGVDFTIGYPSGGLYYRGAPAYYYRTPVDLGRAYYGRPHHHEGCYESHGVHYHGQSCPLVRSYFQRYGHRTDRVFARYAPPYRRDYGHDRGYGDRYDRGYGRGYGDGYYDRHRDYRDRHRHDRRHHRRHHRGHHRHHHGCGHDGY